MPEDRLKDYRAKRDFGRTSEPAGDAGALPSSARRYLIQKHAATRLHFDLRLEQDGVLKSWAVTRGPSLDPADKRLAVQTEDHPLEYGDFEGTIPKGEYGGGTVMLWDEGTWEPLEDAEQGLREGKLKFRLHGARLRGAWMLLRLKEDRARPPRPGARKVDNWLLFKERDDFAAEAGDVAIVERALTSVRSGRTLDEIAAGNLEWTRAGARVRAETEPRRQPRTKTATANESGRAAGGLPAFVPPQMATLVDAPPEGDGWAHEIKYDGYRAMAAIGDGAARIYTRTGLDWSERFAPLLRPLIDLPCTSALIDGEIAVLDAEGRSSFSALQHALAGEGGRFVLYAFDLLWRDGTDLRPRPLLERKAALAELLKGASPEGPLFYSDHVVGNGEHVFDEARRLGLEGIVSKRAAAAYASERGRDWLKTKCGHGQEFIVVGWEPSPVKGKPFAALLMAEREDGRLAYRGKVGSGFSGADLERVWSRLAARATEQPAVDDIPAPVRRLARFVRPELVAEIAFRGRSSDGLIRQGSFKGLREDKQAADVVDEARDGGDGGREMTPRRGNANPPSRRQRAVTSVSSDDSDTIEIEGVRVTHPGRVMFPGRNITKKMLIDYYLLVADRILPHVAGRPLSLVRCPQGQGGECFFQKHASRGFPSEFKPITIRDKSGPEVYLYIEDRQGLVAAVQMGALELHIWGSRVATLEQPERLVFDLDPDESVTFEDVKAAAIDMRDRLAAIGLASFAMATGGKGLHVVAPLTPRHMWDDIRVFAEAMARTMAAEAPQIYLAEMSKTKRKGRIFIDYLRNGRGATAIAPFSTRARGGAPVAWPVAWSALAKLADAHPVAADTAVAALKGRRSDPWRGYFDVDQVIPMERLAAG